MYFSLKHIKYIFQSNVIELATREKLEEFNLFCAIYFFSHQNYEYYGRLPHF